jgi:hypothetical protein
MFGSYATTSPSKERALCLSLVVTAARRPTAQAAFDLSVGMKSLFVMVVKVNLSRFVAPFRIRKKPGE